MCKFIFKRLILIIPILLIMSFLVFMVLRLGPVDPAKSYLINSRIPPTAEAVAVTTKELGLDKPLLVQYGIWLEGAIKLDFGKSYITKRDVFDDLMYYFPTTLKLTLLSMLVVILVSMPLGIGAALKKNSFFDKGIKVFSFAGVSLPNFWLGFILVYIFSVKYKILPPFGNEGVANYIMPIATLSLMSIAINTRLCRASYLEHLGTRSISYLKILGMDKTKIYGKYAFKNSLLPIVTSLGMHFGELLGGAFIVETLFAWPGVGRYMVGALYNHDYPVIQCFMLMMIIIFLMLNLLTDILYAYLNPKIRYES